LPRTDCCNRSRCASTARPNTLSSPAGRRLAALQLLAEQGSIDASFAVPCQVQDGDDATELSLVETTLREQMHPADEFEAFRNLAGNGTPVEDSAARFGVTPAWSNSVSGWPASAPLSSALFVQVPHHPLPISTTRSLPETVASLSIGSERSNEETYALNVNVPNETLKP
jgi:hypothetical protein